MFLGTVYVSVSRVEYPFIVRRKLYPNGYVVSSENNPQDEYLVEYIENTWVWTSNSGLHIRFDPQPILDSISVGGRITLLFDGKRYSLFILNMIPGEIQVGISPDSKEYYRIIFRDGRWVFENNPEVSVLFHGISPESGIFSKLPTLPQIEVLNRLDDQSLINFCESRAPGWEICKSEDLWVDRLKKYHPNFKLLLGETYIQAYNRESTKYVAEQELSKIIKFGRLEDIRPDNIERVVQHAIYKNYYRLLDYIYDEVRDGKMFIMSEMLSLSAEGNIRFYKWLAKKQKVSLIDLFLQHPTENPYPYLTYLIGVGDIKTLEELLKEGLDLNGQVNKFLFRGAIMSERGLEWLANRGIFPSDEDLQYHLEDNRTRILPIYKRGHPDARIPKWKLDQLIQGKDRLRLQLYIDLGYVGDAELSHIKSINSELYEGLAEYIRTNWQNLSFKSQITYPQPILEASKSRSVRKTNKFPK